MPSDTPTEPDRGPRGVGFGTISVAVILVVLVLVSGLILASGYYVARTAIEQDARRLSQNTGAILDLVLDARLQRLEGLLALSAQDTGLREAMAAGDRAALSRQLSAIYDSEQQGHLDILFAEIAALPHVVDVSVQDYDLGPLVEAARGFGAFEMTNQMFVAGPPERPLASILTRLVVIEPVSGRVLGALYGGIVLNDNIGLARELLQRSKATRLTVLHGERTLVAYPPGPNDGEDDAVDDAPPDGDARDGALVFDNDLNLQKLDREPFHVVTWHAPGAIADLQANFRKTLILFVVSIVVGVGFAAWILRRAMQTALHSLTSYAQTASEGGATASFVPSAIREFNEVGNTLEGLVRALRDSETRAQTILDNASAIIYVKDREGRYVFTNRLFVQRVGLAQDALLGRTVDQILPAETADRLTRRDRAVLESGEPTRYEEEISHPTRVYTYFTSRFPLRDGEGRIQGLCGIATDITEFKDSQRALQQALEEAERANAAKSHFLATMSHEFRTPLNAILGFSDLLRMQGLVTPSVERFREYADDIHQSGQHMLALVNDILDIATIEAGKRHLEPETVDVAPLLQDCLRNMEQIAAENGVALRLALEPDLPIAFVDRRSLVQIVLNLVSNAIKYTPADGQVTVSAKRREDWLCLAVADTGVGIAPDRLASVTEPFAQDHDDPHVFQQGTGLGLSIVKALVEAHDGRLDIVSQLASGTTVTIELPLTVVPIAASRGERA